jgi:hypothetical protein
MDFDYYKLILTQQVAVLKEVSPESIKIDETWLRQVFDDLQAGRHRKNELVVAQEWLSYSENPQAAIPSA